MPEHPNDAGSPPRDGKPPATGQNGQPASAQSAGTKSANAGPTSAKPMPSGSVSGGPVSGQPARTARFLVAALPPAPEGSGGLWDVLEQQPDTTILRRISPTAGTAAAADVPQFGATGFPEIAVVEMPVAAAATVAGWPGVLVEPDLPLAYDPPPAWGSGLSQPDPGLLVPLREPVLLRLAVQDTDGKPVQGALVSVAGSAAASHGVTSAEGRVTLQLVADTPETIRSIVVRPVAGHWGVRIDAPRLTGDSPEPITVPGLGSGGEKFGQRQHTGWGVSALRVSDLPPTYRGHRIKVALMDSGISTSHPELKAQVAGGMDVNAGRDGSWDEDATGHGTWCAGIIAGEQDGGGIAGIAADAELHALKLFPGGHTSDLISALDYCIETGIDVAQISLTPGASSQLTTWKLHEAHARGVACIAGAGDHGGPVAFPASAAPVLAVGAIGRAGQCPPGTIPAGYETSTHTPDGFFLPPFTAFSGPAGGVDLCAPGVAVPATASPDGYTMADGTGVAAAHISGLAALVLAHHSDFRDTFRHRDGARVDRLFALLRASCTPVPVDDPRRTGAGLPDARRALSLTFDAGPAWQQFAYNPFP
ncbi:MAG: peptidase and in kexin sedolisin [Actinomycetia bacterium]|nr:peptidase and in kexin sedolisin [Actinomycetes bacterium]